MELQLSCLRLNIFFFSRTTKYVCNDCNWQMHYSNFKRFDNDHIFISSVFAVASPGCHGQAMRILFSGGVNKECEFVCFHSHRSTGDFVVFFFFIILCSAQRCLFFSLSTQNHKIKSATNATRQLQACFERFENKRTICTYTI